MLYKLLFFLFISISIFADGYQSKNERISAIDKEIEILMEKKYALENLKEKISKINSEEITTGKSNTRQRLLLF